VTTIRIGTRGSKLALAQAGLVADRLRASDPVLDIEIVTISTAGDRDQSTPLSSGEGAGWFTTAIQQALTAGEVDVAVHSYKDLPTKRPEGRLLPPSRSARTRAMRLSAAHPGGLHELPRGAVVGTSSPRREAQVREVRPDVEVHPIRGNVENRVAKVDGASTTRPCWRWLASAPGYRIPRWPRLRIRGVAAGPRPGALAVECRTDDLRTRTLLEAIDDPAIRVAVTAERVFLATIDGGCSFPAAAFAEQFGTTLKLNALIAADGRIIRSKMAGPVATAAGLGRALAEELMALGGPR